MSWQFGVIAIRLLRWPVTDRFCAGTRSVRGFVLGARLNLDCSCDGGKVCLARGIGAWVVCVGSGVAPGLGTGVLLAYAKDDKQTSVRAVSQKFLLGIAIY